MRWYIKAIQPGYSRRSESPRSSISVRELCTDGFQLFDHHTNGMADCTCYNKGRSLLCCIPVVAKWEWGWVVV